MRSATLDSQGDQEFREQDLQNTVANVIEAIRRSFDPVCPKGERSSVGGEVYAESVSHVRPDDPAARHLPGLLPVPGRRQRYEILDGEIYTTPSPSTRHQYASKRLQRLLEAYFEERLGYQVFNAPLDVILADDDVVQPDLIVVAERPQMSRRGIEGPRYCSWRSCPDRASSTTG